MSALSRQSIRRLAVEQGMISPFVDHQVREEDGRRVVSYGLGPAGYDVRLSDEFLVCEMPNVHHASAEHRIDPKNFPVGIFRKVSRAPYIDIPPNGFVLGTTVERFRMPKNVLGICFGKSTYARCATNPVVTPLEPGWEADSAVGGQITIEVTNASPWPARIYAGEGIVQVVFMWVDEEPDQAYEGRYNGQSGIVLPRMGV